MDSRQFPAITAPITFTFILLTCPFLWRKGHVWSRYEHATKGGRERRGEGRGKEMEEGEERRRRKERRGKKGKIWKVRRGME